MGVHNTNFYEVEGQDKVNPVGGLEMDDAAYATIQVCLLIYYSQSLILIFSSYSYSVKDLMARTHYLMKV